MFFYDVFILTILFLLITNEFNIWFYIKQKLYFSK